MSAPGWQPDGGTWRRKVRRPGPPAGDLDVEWRALMRRLSGSAIRRFWPDGTW